eukprot:m.513035 g.513035  ORF g.513035 m.513035 type:complete len:228 (-) comp57438_c0_seq61:479-1162(-)
MAVFFTWFPNTARLICSSICWGCSFSTTDSRRKIGQEHERCVFRTFGYTALLRAVEAGSLGCYQVLRDAGADPLARTMDGWTTLHLVNESADEDFWEVLFESGADINVQTSGGLTPLMAAVEALYAAFVQRLLDAGAVTAPRMRDGRNVLHLAAEQCSVRILKILLRACTVAEMNAQDRYGVTPLVCATTQERIDEQDPSYLHRAASPPRRIAQHSDFERADCARLG